MIKSFITLGPELKSHRSAYYAFDKFDKPRGDFLFPDREKY